MLVLTTIASCNDPLLLSRDRSLPIDTCSLLGDVVKEFCITFVAAAWGDCCGGGGDMDKFESELLSDDVYMCTDVCVCVRVKND